MTPSRLRKAGLALALAGAVGGGYALGNGAVAPSRALAEEPAARAAQSVSAPRGAPDFASIVERYGPAVVNVAVTGAVRTAGPQFGPGGRLDPDDPLAPFLRRFMPPPGQQRSRGIGSGFIVKDDGFVLTNAHVVDGASEVKVKLADGREFEAKVVGMDKPTDVAVLRVEAKGLPTVKLGDPARAQVGDWVLAIGAPFGFEASATAGIISAKARALPSDGYVPFLQTDVAVNPGNSGGPLFNAAGEVIGVNSQIYSSSGGYQGLSFAIPIDVAMKVQGQLVAHGKVSRGRLGVTIQDVNQALASSFGLPKPEGALVSAVEKGSPAALAGVEPGDVVLKLDGQPVARSTDLPPRVADLAPGSKAKLQLWRKGATREVTVTVGEQPGEKVASAGGAGGEGGKLGLAVRPLTPAERSQAGVEGGLVVEGVSGPAERAGLQPGDVVLAVNGAPVESAEKLARALDRDAKQVALLVQRGEGRLYVPVEIG